MQVFDYQCIKLSFVCIYLLLNAVFCPAVRSDSLGFTGLHLYALYCR